MFVDPWFWFWAFLVLAGFAYVAGCLCGRSNPLLSRSGQYDQIIKIAISIPFLYFLGPYHNLKPNELKLRSVLLRTGAGYVLPFFIALHWYYMQDIPNINYSLTAHDLGRMPAVARVVFGAGGVLILALAIYHSYLAHKQGILCPYLSTFFGAIVLLVGISWGLRDSHTFHIHHYFLFGFFIPWTRFPASVSLVCQALCAGIYVEGISEWSMATLWYPK